MTIHRSKVRAGGLRRALFALIAGLSVFLGGERPVLGAPGQVYLVLGSDTAIWNAGTTVDVYTRHPHYKQDSFTDPASAAYQVMDPAVRNRFKDSFGQALKLTWWMMGGNVFRDADNLNVPLANTMTMYLMKKYHGDAIAKFGDELSLHYHTFLWSDYNGDGKYCWNQSRTFRECREDFDCTMAQYLLEEEIYPVSFRSGWHFMDNDWQQYLDQLLPYGMHNNSPNKSTDTTEPLGNVYDWSKATTKFIPFHPSRTNYQTAGDGKGWDVRSIKMQSLRQTDMNNIFSQAAGGTMQVACIWSHLPENFLGALTNVGSLIRVAASKYPAVQFRYCTAVEAMQRWRGTPDRTPPELDVTETIQGQTVTLALRTSEPIFQALPFVALRDAFQQYTNVTSLCVPAGSNAWTLTLPVPRNRLAKAGIAVTDLAGNLTTRLLRQLPDDLYVDNLDPQYAEVEGTWSSATNAAWGTDARIARLTGSYTAVVRWALPISRAGLYSLAVQVPPLANAASNVVFNVHAGESNIYSVFFARSLPANQWVDLGSLLLVETLSNSLEMIVRGTNQPGAYAVADVVRLTPLADTNAPIIACSSNIVAPCGGPNGIPVTFAVTATDAGDPRPVVACSVNSGALFPPGVTTVLCTAGDASGNKTSCSFTVLVMDAQPPSIAEPPQSRTNLVGTGVTFSVVADSCAPIRYRWRFASIALTGETNATLTITNVQLIDAGDYSVELSNSGGSVISVVAKLVINRPPVAFVRGAATTVNRPVSITLAQLVGPGFDPDGEPLAVSVSTTSRRLGSVNLTGSNVVYLPPPGFIGTDSFDYNLSDGRGGTASAEVAILVVEGSLPLQGQVAMTATVDGFRIRFAGVPGSMCSIQRSTNLNTWTTLDAVELPPHGILEYKDRNPPLQKAFYRVGPP